MKIKVVIEWTSEDEIEIPDGLEGDDIMDYLKLNHKPIPSKLVTYCYNEDGDEIIDCWH